MSHDILDNSESYGEDLFRIMGIFARELELSGLFTTFRMQPQAQEQEQEQDEDKQLECESLKLEEAEED